MRRLQRDAIARAFSTDGGAGAGLLRQFHGRYAWTATS
jgi:hypothetical protein